MIGDKDFAGPGEPLAEALPDGSLVTLRNVDHFATPKDFGCIDAALGFLGHRPLTLEGGTRATRASPGGLALGVPW